MFKNSKLLFSLAQQKSKTDALSKAAKGDQPSQDAPNFGEYAFRPSINSSEHLSPVKLNEVANKIY